MKAVAIIPARGGSKGVPGKNFRPLNGRPLLAYSIEAARMCPLVDRIVVSTESPELAAIAVAHGAEVPFLRPPELAGDKADLGQVVDHVLLSLGYAGSFVDAHIVLLPTSPFRSRGLMEFLGGLLAAGHAAVHTARRIPPRPLCRPGPDGGLRLVADGDRPAMFRSYGLFSGACKLGDKPAYVHVVEDPLQLVDIDTPEDFALAETIAASGAFDFEAPMPPADQTSCR